MPITKLKLKDFQPWHRLSLELDLKATTLVGPSDLGKSSVLRSFRWICTNRPSGDAFIRKGSDGCTIAAEVDGTRIIRKKGKGKNAYIISRQKDGTEREANHSGNDFLPETEPGRASVPPSDRRGGVRNVRQEDRRHGESVFQAFGQEVPEPIQKILNVGDVNFQFQFDAPFWLGLTPGQLAKELNGVVDLGLIDSVLAQASSDLRKAKSEAEVCEDRLAAATARRDALAWAREADEELKGIEAKAEVIGELEEEVTSLSSCLDEAKAARGILAGLEEKGVRLDCLVEKAKELDGLEREVENLELLTTEISASVMALGVVKEGIAKVDGELARVKECPMCGGRL